jgi:glutamate dehydrogenase
MENHSSEKISNILVKLEAMFQKNFSKQESENLLTLTREYFNVVSEEELVDRDLYDIYGMILSFWHHMYHRGPDETKIRVYNPVYEQCGWRSKHTVIEVINDDRPFLVDTLLMVLNQLDLGMHFLMYVGACIVKRGADNEALVVYETNANNVPTKDVQQESLILVEVDRQNDDPAIFEKIKLALQEAYDKVSLVVDDYGNMKQKLSECIKSMKSSNAKQSEDYAEGLAFLEWIKNDHFIFMGYTELDGKKAKSKNSLTINKSSTLGLLKLDNAFLSTNFHDFAQRLGSSTDKHPLLTIAKSDHFSPVHRASRMDIIGALEYNDDGEVIGEKRFLGLYTSAAYHKTPDSIPFLRRKVQKIFDRAGFRTAGHSYKTLKNILETYPRDELFLTEDDQLFDTCMGMLQIKERQKVKLFTRRDSYNRYHFCMLFMPRERYNSVIREKIQTILLDALNGYRVEFKANFIESTILCRVDFTIYTDPAAEPKIADIGVIEEKILYIGRQWSDDLHDALIEEFGENLGRRNYLEYKDSFPPAYEHDFIARSGVTDIRHFEAIKKGKNIGMMLYRLLEEPANRIRFKLYVKDNGIQLSNVLPILENMGMYVIEERPYKIKPESGGFVSVSDFGLRVDESFNMESARDLFQDAFDHIWDGTAENDRFNYLITYSELTWRDIALIRGYARYITQIGARFTRSFITDTFIAYPDILKSLIELFYARFDPSVEATKEESLKIQDKLVKNIKSVLNQVKSIEQDKILHLMLSSIMATIRTNFFQKDAKGNPKEFVSFKIQPSKIPGVPKPTPMFEIYVYSQRVEGVHLRFSNVARGGLRWSDRSEDYRTEVLGLAKAQQVKNAVIVPMGAKGGFVPKHLPKTGNRADIQAEGIACYKIFISALLELTDNLVNDKIVAPENTVRYDKDDPYLVVAADKGTATFSDIANGLAEDKGFWLGDAFASGGSNGYDHKKMGITARGAWESVKIHFRENNIDIQKQDFTCVGVGDMAGDVFGNGMLLSKCTRLIAAFNHLHIFIDPNPDAKKTWPERKRLFDLPQSSWEDYDKSLISAGGGIFSRAEKSIPLSKEIKALLGTNEDTLEPNELISKLLTLNVDLLWNGGIGTYVKASTESNSEVGDRANDDLRVNANALRCKVVGEGGNLGFTQLGRVEFALNGGKMNTDAIDNSAGVDCSDHEVNIKILLNAVVEKGELTPKRRNEVLASMSDEVADLVLFNNYYQNQTLSNTNKNGTAAVETYSRLMRELERKTLFDRDIEFLPSDKDLSTRAIAGKGITSPELSVLMAYAKSLIKEKILQSDVTSDPFFYKYLEKEFPVVLREKYGSYMKSHRLAKEIIATQLTNALCMYTGVTFVQRLSDETGASIANIVKSFAVVSEIFNLEGLWHQVQQMDTKITIQTQHLVHNTIFKKARRICRWLLKNNRSGIQVEELINHYKPNVASLSGKLMSALNPDSVSRMKSRIKDLTDRNIPDGLARLVAFIQMSSPVMDIMNIAEKENIPDSDLMTGFMMLNDKLSLSWFRDTIVNLGKDSYWGHLTSSSMLDDIDRLQCELVAFIYSQKHESESFSSAVNRWEKAFPEMTGRLMGMISDLKADQPKFVSATIAFRALLDLVQVCRHGSCD